MSSAKSYDEWHLRVHGSEAAHETLLQIWHEDALAIAGDVRGLDVLEVGCGAGDFSIHLASLGAALTGTDFSPQAIQIAQRKASAQGVLVDFRVADAQCLTFPENSFDLIVSCECLEHVPEPKVALAEMYRVLRPGGRLVLTTENYSNAMLLYWLISWLKGLPFDSGAGIQPIEHFFLYWRVRRMMREAGFWFKQMKGSTFMFLGAPGFAPSVFAVERIKSNVLSRVLIPFARHVSFELSKKK